MENEAWFQPMSQKYEINTNFYESGPNEMRKVCVLLLFEDQIMQILINFKHFTSFNLHKQTASIFA